jgi:hypothetical protein
MRAVNVWGVCWVETVRHDNQKKSARKKKEEYEKQTVLTATMQPLAPYHIWTIMHNHAPHLTALDRTALYRTAYATHRIDVNGSHEKIDKVITASTQCCAELRGKHKKWSSRIESIDRWQHAPGRRTCGCRTRIRKRKQVSTLLPLGRPRSVKAKLVKTLKTLPKAGHRLAKG